MIEVGKYKIEINYVTGWSDPPNTEEYEQRPGGFIIGWAAKEIGFGQLTVWRNEDGILRCHDEYMSPEFCEAVLLALARSWKVG